MYLDQIMYSYFKQLFNGLIINL